MDGLAGGGVESLAGLDGTLLDHEADVEHGRERVGELQNASGGDEAGQIADLWDGGGDEEGDAPVDRHDDDPGEFPRAGAKAGEAEVVHQNVVVDHLDADVAVEHGRDKRGGQAERVRYGLPCVRRYALVGGVDGVLALVGEDHQAEDHVDEVDEELGA